MMEIPKSRRAIVRELSGQDGGAVTGRVLGVSQRAAHVARPNESLLGV